MLEGRDAAIGRFAWVMAWVGLVVGQLHALARFSVPEHATDTSEYPLTAAWADPPRELFSPLLTWGDPDLVYVTWGKIWFPVFAAFTLGALVVYRRRAPAGFEKWAWRAAIAAYALACLGVFLDYWTQWTGDYNVLFLVGTWVTFPALGLMLVTSTVLGVTLLAKRFRPVLPALLLALVVPAGLAITEVTSLGSAALPVMFAFGILGRRIARAEAPPARLPAPA
jgi:hypothetical protein